MDEPAMGRMHSPEAGKLHTPGALCQVWTYFGSFAFVFVVCFICSQLGIGLGLEAASVLAILLDVLEDGLELWVFGITHQLINETLRRYRNRA